MSLSIAHSRFPGFIQRSLGLVASASDILNGPFRRIRGTQGNICRSRAAAFTGPIDSHGLCVRMVSPGTAGSHSRIGGAVGNPADVLNVRMQNDMALPLEQRRNYKHALDGLIRLIREEGPRSLMRGVWANTSRGVLMTAGQLASYDEFKKLLMKTGLMRDNLGTHFTASFMAGFVATTMYVISCGILIVDVPRLMYVKRES